MAHVGEDRGARIDIEGCSFKHSKFCKGMISYRKTDPITFEMEPKYIKFSNQMNRTTNYTYPDDREESYIRINNSLFENLAW